MRAQQALERLIEGNRRFVAERAQQADVSKLQRARLTEGQAPFAIILGCSDSRVPAEIVFDQGLGDLFVIRVAGNVVAPSQIGSVEFAAQRFGTPLVVVLGHARCGAVMASLESIEDPSTAETTNVLSIVNRIRPAIEPLCQTELKNKPSELLEAAVRANILASANHLRHGSQLLENMVASGQLTVIGAEYSLDTGGVELIETI